MSTVDSETILVTVCNTCRVIVAEDKGRPIDVPIVATRVSSHISTPSTIFTKDLNHEILTVNLKDGKSDKGLVLTKSYSD